jgi:hypothetical protein
MLEVDQTELNRGWRRMIPNIPTLLGFAKTLEGEPLQTLRRKQTFYVAVIGHDLEFIPASSRATRRRQYNPVKALLDQVAQRTGLSGRCTGPGCHRL